MNKILITLLLLIQLVLAGVISPVIYLLKSGVMAEIEYNTTLNCNVAYFQEVSAFPMVVYFNNDTNDWEVYTDRFVWKDVIYFQDQYLSVRKAVENGQL